MTVSAFKASAVSADPIKVGHPRGGPIRPGGYKPNQPPSPGYQSRAERGISMFVPKLNSFGGLIAAATLSIAALGISLTSPGMATVALASGSSDLVSATNASRAADGLPALQENGSLDSVAQGWANKLAIANVLSHNPNLQSQVTNWQDLGENVGMGPSVPTLEQAFMASPDHKANILDTNYTQVGVGTATSIYPGCNCQILWVVVDFRRPASAAAPVKVAPKVPAAPKPPAAPTHSAVPVHPVTPVVTPTHSASAPATATPTTPAVQPPSATTPATTAAATVASAPSAPSFLLSAKVTQVTRTTDDSPTSTVGADPVSSVLDFASALAALS
jgi:uncharacterized protein YkwD